MLISLNGVSCAQIYKREFVVHFDITYEILEAFCSVGISLRRPVTRNLFQIFPEVPKL